MAMSNVSEIAVLALTLCGTAWSGYADNTATSPITSHAIALHTADPTGAGTQATSETTYTGYARGAVARSTSGWSTPAGSPASSSLVAALNFPSCTGGSANITNWSIGKPGGGATAILVSGAISPAFNVTSGAAPQLSTSTTVTCT